MIEDNGFILRLNSRQALINTMKENKPWSKKI